MAKNIDWANVEREYLSGERSLRDIGAEYGIDEALIRRRAKKENWSRDLRERVRSRADIIVRKEEVRKLSARKVRKVTEAEIIEASANTQVQIIFAHRKDIKRSRELGFGLFQQCESQTVDNELFEQLGELMKKPEGNYDKLNTVYQKVLSFPSRVDSYKKLTDALKTMIGLERQAFGLADNANGDADTPKEKVIRVEFVAPPIRNIHTVEDSRVIESA